MKALVTSCVLLCLVSVSAFSKGIEFIDGGWDDAVDMAKSENKLIFIDVHTDWCGPCKILAKEVFTQDSVGDFYNRNFINFKLNAEEGEGVDLSEAFDVAAYPTLLFVSVADGEKKMVRRKVGSMKAEQLIALGREALDPSAYKTSLMYMDQQFVSGERDKDFVVNYLAEIQKARINPDSRLASYLGSLSRNELVSVDSFNLIEKYSSKVRNGAMAYLFDNYNAFVDLVGRNQTFKLVVDKSISLYHGHYGAASFHNNAMIDYLSTVNFPDKVQLISLLELEHLHRGHDWKELVAKTIEYIEHYAVRDPGSISRLVQKSYRSVEDPEHLAVFLKAIDSVVTEAAGYPELYLQGAFLSEKLGLHSKAVQLASSYQDSVADKQKGLQLARTYWELSKIYAKSGEKNKAIEMAKDSLALMDGDQYKHFAEPVKQFLAEVSAEES